MRVDSTGRVLVGYPAREGNELAIRGNPRLLLHILRFTSDGKLDLSVSLPTDNIPHNAIFLDAHDHLLVVANGLLQMLTGDDEMPIQQRTWRVITSCSWPAEGCRAEQSPTRQQLFITKCPESNPFCEIPGLTVYDTSLPEPQSTKTCTRRGGRTTDKFGYLSGWDKGYYTRRYPLCGADTPQDLPIHDAVCAVLNDSLFVVCSGKDERLLAVITERGDTKFQLYLPKHDTPNSNIDYVKGNAVGDRFAIVIDTGRGGSSTLDISGHLTARRVVVYSSESGSELVSVGVYPPVPHYGVALGIVPGFTFDLSSTGRVLAVLSEGILTITRISE